MKKTIALVVGILVVGLFISMVFFVRLDGLTFSLTKSLYHTQKRIEVATTDDPVGATLLYFDAVLRMDEQDALKYLLDVDGNHERLIEAISMSLAYRAAFGLEKEELVRFQPSKPVITTVNGVETAEFSLTTLVRQMYTEDLDLEETQWKVLAVRTADGWKVVKAEMLDWEFTTYDRDNS